MHAQVRAAERRDTPEALLDHIGAAVSCQVMINNSVLYVTVPLYRVMTVQMICSIFVPQTLTNSEISGAFEGNMAAI